MQDGRFAPGHSGNAKGKPLGARDKATQIVDKLLFKNIPGIAEVLVREANAGQHWAVKAALGPMLPGRARKIANPVDREPVTTTADASQRIAEIFARMENGELDLDEGQALIAALQAFIAGRNVATLEQQAEEGRAEIARLREEIAGMRMRG
jgi:hypothetical protein